MAAELDEEGRGLIVHAAIMFKESQADVDAYLRKNAIVRTMLVALVAKVVGYQGAIIGWTTGRATPTRSPTLRGGLLTKPSGQQHVACTWWTRAQPLEPSATWGRESQLDHKSGASLNSFLRSCWGPNLNSTSTLWGRDDRHDMACWGLRTLAR